MLGAKVNYICSKTFIYAGFILHKKCDAQTPASLLYFLTIFDEE